MKQSVIAQNFCKNIKRLREDSFFSMEFMANLCGVDVPTLRKIERGRLTIELVLHVSARLYDTLSVSPVDLISEDILVWQQ